jgi:hypothetical protein
MDHKPPFKITIGGGDWGSPLSDEATFETLDEAQAAAREYVDRQRRDGGGGVLLRVMIEETQADGSVVEHRVG